MQKALAMVSAAALVLSGCTGVLDGELAAKRAEIGACTQVFGVAGGVVFVETDDGRGVIAQASEELSIRDRTIVNGCIDEVASGRQTTVARARNVPISPCPRGSAVMRAGAGYCVGLK